VIHLFSCARQPLARDADDWDEGEHHPESFMDRWHLDIIEYW